MSELTIELFYVFFEIVRKAIKGFFFIKSLFSDEIAFFRNQFLKNIRIINNKVFFAQGGRLSTFEYASDHFS
jgi:hypothetical protein